MVAFGFELRQLRLASGEAQHLLAQLRSATEGDAAQQLRELFFRGALCMPYHIVKTDAAGEGVVRLEDFALFVRKGGLHASLEEITHLYRTIAAQKYHHSTAAALLPRDCSFGIREFSAWLWGAPLHCDSSKSRCGFSKTRRYLTSQELLPSNSMYSNSEFERSGGEPA